MFQKDTKIGIIGNGGWGTALALLLSGKGYAVTLWGVEPEYIEEIKKKRENRKFLPGFKIPETVQLSSNIHEVVKNSKIVVLATPAQFMRSVLRKIKDDSLGQKVFVSVAKGIEVKSLKTMSQIFKEEISAQRICVVSGPSIAREVALKMPAAVSVASRDKKLRSEVRQVFTTEYFNLFESDDVLGVELGAAVKNVVAIAAGIVEGLGFGSNTQAALFARGVAEMARLGVAMGAKRETFMGLSGLGDLATTCLSSHSRNHSLGIRIGRGESLSKILKSTEMIVEGVETSKSAYALARKNKISMPITETVHGILFQERDSKSMVKALMQAKPHYELA